MPSSPRDAAEGRSANDPAGSQPVRDPLGPAVSPAGEPAALERGLARVGMLEPVAGIAAVLVLLAVVASLGSIETVSAALVAGKAMVVARFDSFFVAVANISLLALVIIAMHPAAKKTLGDAGDRPQFSRPTWFAMLFSAGLASGLLYWATAEPILHLQHNPFQSAAPAEGENGLLAMRITMLHWGIHGWAFYAVAALAIAIQGYRRNSPLTFRVALTPLFGEKWVAGWPGRAIDLLAVFGTISGVATSIGLSASSLNATMSSLAPIAVSVEVQVLIVLGVGLLGVASALSGVSRGIRLLSSINAWVSLGLMLAFLALGPTRAVLGLLFETFADYAWHALPIGLYVGETSEARVWQGDWTVFYWAWWLAWTPFVSLFIARISRGRSIREFLIAVTLVPTAVTLVWMSIFGGTALAQEAAQPGSISDPVNLDYSLGLVAVIEQLGAGSLAIVLVSVATFLLFTWLVTSLDSATLVLCHLVGAENVPGAAVFWGAALAIVAAVLLVAGGLQALQAASIVMGLPLAGVVLFIVAGLGLDLVRGRL